MIMELFEYLGKAFREQHKFLKKSNIPMVVVLSKLALENDIKPENSKYSLILSAILYVLIMRKTQDQEMSSVSRRKVDCQQSQKPCRLFDLVVMRISLSVEKIELI